MNSASISLLNSPLMYFLGFSQHLFSSLFLPPPPPYLSYTKSLPRGESAHRLDDDDDDNNDDDDKAKDNVDDY